MAEDDARPLRGPELAQVHPRIRHTVIEAWERGEEVPFGVAYLDFRPPTAAEEEYATQIAAALAAAEDQPAKENDHA